MHLWPSSRIRDSFKLGYLSKLEWNLHRMKTEKQSQTNQQLLGNQNEGDDKEIRETPKNGNSKVVSLWREFFLFLSCCYCCFCCDACDNQEDL